MRIGSNIRNWGQGSEAGTLVECATAADAAGIATLWVNERLCTPPDRGWAADDGGRYLDAMLTLTYLASVTERIGLGTGVINVPYRLPFQLAKQAATLQDLSGGRFVFGVGTGWYETEFEVIGVPFRERGRQTDAALALIHDAFANDEVARNGHVFPMLPRPARPPIYVGGSSALALRRTVRFGDGWIPAGQTPEELAEPMARLRELASQAGKPTPKVIAMKTLPLEDVPAAIELALAYREAGAQELVHAGGYPDTAAFRRRIDILAGEIAPAVA